MYDSVSINDVAWEQPNTASMRVKEFTPVAGSDVVVTLGSINNSSKLFAGVVLSITQDYDGIPENVRYSLALIDYTWTLNRRKVTWRYTNMSATDIAIHLLGIFAYASAGPDDWSLDSNQCGFFGGACAGSTSISITGGAGGVEWQAGQAFTLGTDQVYTVISSNNSSSLTFEPPLDGTVPNGTPLTPYDPGEFRSDYVAEGLPVIDEITFTNEDLTDAFTRLAKRIGAQWYLDYDKVLHLFVGEEGLDTPPVTLEIDRPSLEGFVYETDLSQVATRAVGEGMGSSSLIDFDAPTSADSVQILPIENASAFNASGGKFVSGPQRMTYQTRFLGGQGALVGPGASPTTRVDLDLAVGAGIESGEHGYAVTYVTADGESIPGPTRTIEVGEIDEPDSAPSVSRVAGTGVDVGDHKYAVTFVNGAGETTGGPESETVTTESVTTGTIAAPVTAPTAGTPTPGGNVTTGTHQIAVTFINAAGETTAGPSTSRNVPAFPEPTNLTIVLAGDAAGLLDVAQYFYGVTFVTANGETTVGAVHFNDTTAANRNFQLTVGVGPSGTIARKIYRSEGGGGSGNLKLLATLNDNTTTSYFDNIADGSLGAAPPGTNTATLDLTIPLSNVPIGPAGTTGRRVYMTTSGGAQLKLVSTIGNNTATTYNITMADGSLGANVPTTNTTGTTTNFKKVLLSNIPIGPASTTSRKIYRTAANGSQLKLLTTISDNTTATFLDDVADASLGANIPTTNTASANRVDVSGIPIGATAVTARKLYRTAAGGSQLKLLTTISDNTTTTYADSTADASLGANAPTVDLSNLTQPEGQIAPGSTSLPLSGNIYEFPGAGGYVIIGEQLIRYETVNSNSLLGIPSSGPGSIQSPIGYNQTAIAAPILYGVVGQRYAILRGDDVNLLVVEDDFAAQASLAAIAGGTGVVETFIQNRTLGETEMAARCRATLAVLSPTAERIGWRSHDVNTRSSLIATSSMGSPINVSGEYRIQQVTISGLLLSPSSSQFDAMPWFQASASAQRFSFEDLLRQIKERGK